MVLHGRGIQDWYTKSYENDRRKALRWRYNFTSDELSDLDIGATEGTGRTKEDTFELKQFPFPANPSIRPAKKVKITAVDPRIGEMSDD